MSKFLLPSLLTLLVFSVLTGIVYPLAVTGIAALCFGREAQGSLIRQSDRLLGSTLLGQPFDDPKYFWSRPSATSPQPYNGGASAGSNLGPTNPAQIDAVKAHLAALQQADPDNKLPVPVDLVTASGSGLDPDISPAAAEYQLTRVARVRYRCAEAARPYRRADAIASVGSVRRASGQCAATQSRAGCAALNTLERLHALQAQNQRV
jgi:potassium-transporting ATPase KdpC subunit